MLPKDEGAGERPRGLATIITHAVSDRRHPFGVITSGAAREASRSAIMATMASAAFARIRAQVLDIVARVPVGRVTTFGTIATELECSPRHVAFVLARLPDDVDVPWQRVVSAGGRLAPGEVGNEQRLRLLEEGLRVEAGRVVGFAGALVVVPLDEAHRTDPATPLSRARGAGT